MCSSCLNLEHGGDEHLAALEPERLHPDLDGEEAAASATRLPATPHPRREFLNS